MAAGNAKANRRKPSAKSLFKLFVVLGVCVYVAVTFISQRITLRKCDDAKEVILAQTAEAALENQRLNDELKKADTDEYLMQVARDELGLVKPNERVFIDITGE